jgi:hypothetical protein
MLSHVRDELDSYETRVLEPACGSGNFLVPILAEKLESVDANFSSSGTERFTRALHAAMSIYGIELLEDNVSACRDRLLTVMELWANNEQPRNWLKAAEKVLKLNVVCGDALSFLEHNGNPLRLSEWSISGDTSFSRREFEFSDLLASNSYRESTLFDPIATHEMFSPVRAQSNLDLSALAKLES